MGAYVCIYGHICAYMGHMCVRMGHMCVDNVRSAACACSTENPESGHLSASHSLPTVSDLRNSFFSASGTSKIGGGGGTFMGGWGPMCVKIQIRATKSPMPYIHIFVCMYVCMYVCLVAWCNSNPMVASGAHPPEVPSVAGNTQANDTLPSIVGRGGANCRITPGPHTQLFGGAQHPPTPRGTALPGAPP